MAKRLVLGIGEARMEHLAVVERQPDSEAVVDMLEFSMQGAGTAATAVALLGKLGVPTAFWGRLGDDDFGRFIMRGLAGLGVDTSTIMIQPGGVSPYAFVLVEHARTRRTIFRTGGTVDLLRPTDVPWDALERASVVMLDGYQKNISLEAARRARANGATVVLDCGGSCSPVPGLIAEVDVLITTERFISDLAPHAEIEDSLREIQRMGPGTIVVTMGKEGSVGLQGETMVRQLPLAVEVVDTTGAGDVFLGGFCFALVEGYDLKRAMQFASTAAGLSCRALGARSRLPTLSEIETVAG